MLVGVGIGTELALNGTAAHAFAHIIYKSLLFMSMGAVLQQAGTVSAVRLGGLYRRMPWTATFCIVGAASISAFPLLSGFVSKAMIMTALVQTDHVFIWLVMLFASAGVLEHAGIKIRSEEHTSELQSRGHLVCRLLLEKKKIKTDIDKVLC